MMRPNFQRKATFFAVVFLADAGWLAWQALTSPRIAVLAALNLAAAVACWLVGHRRGSG